MPHDPDWLRWSRELQAIAQAGLAYSRDVYDRERFIQLRTLAGEILSQHTGTPAQEIVALFAGETGYPTPKLDVRGAVFNPAGEILMVREVADNNRWTLPGGWADVNTTPAGCVLKEIREESGYTARVRKLAAAWDRTTQGHPSGVFSCWKLFFLCDLVGGEQVLSHETSEIAWFPQDRLPEDLSLGRVLPRHLQRMFAHHADPALPTDFD